MPTGNSNHLTRRSFMPLAAGASAAALLSTKAWSAAKPIPAGIQLYTVNADLQKDPAGTLQKIAKIGYREVETAGFANLTAAQFRDLVKDAGLRAPSAHLNFGMAETSKLLDDAKTLGVQYVCSSILPPRPLDASSGMKGLLQTLNTMTVDDFKLVASRANEIAKQAKAVGLQYAYHNHNFEFRDLGGGVKGYDILLRQTDPSLVKFEADTGWMRVGGVDPVRYLTRHPNRFVMLHIKDFKNITKPVTTLMAPDAPTPTELGRGEVDLKAIVAAGRKVGVKHMFVEQEPPFKDMAPLEAAAADFATLHSLLTGV